MADVDVIVPCYQHGQYLRECVESALNQSGAEVRVLIVDNASTDGSADIARKLADEYPRIDVRVHEKNLGPIASINEGLEWASADYMMLLAADDWITPGCFSRAIEVMEKHPEIVFAFGREVEMLDRVAVTVPDQPDEAAAWRSLTAQKFILELSPPGSVGAGAIVVRTTAQKRAGPYREGLSHAFDLEMLMRLATQGRVADIDAVQGIRRLHPTTQSSSLRRDATGQLVEIERAFENFFSGAGASLQDAHQIRHAVLRNVGSCAYWRALSRLVSGRPRDALELFRLARRLSPRAFVVPPLDYLTKVSGPLTKIRVALRR